MSRISPLSDALAGDVAHRAPRKNLFLMASLAVAGASHPVRVRNLSATGALVESARLPAAGSDLVLRRGSVEAVGTLVWTADQRGGVRFAQPIRLADWIPGGAADHQLEIDPSAAPTRADIVDIAQAPPPADNVGSPVTARIADELAFVARRLETLGADLADEPPIVVRHAAKLQELDIAVQILGHLSRVLVAPSPDAAVERIGMADLRRRLRRAAL